ncbi:MAG: MCP four helix bundle domain-containing protein [Limnohabitans sp.]|jgi:hypothetical protein
MLKNLKVSTRLYLLVLCISFVSIVIGLMGLRGMHQAIGSFQFVNTDHLVHLRDLKIISDQYTLHIADSTHKVRSGKMS